MLVVLKEAQMITVKSKYKVKFLLKASTLISANLLQIRGNKMTQKATAKKLLLLKTPQEFSRTPKGR